jgi:hypothetical protein
MSARAVVLMAAASIAAGAAVAGLKLWYHCRAPESEACVWGKAYSAVALPVESLLYGAIAFALMVAVRRLLRAR